MPEPVLSVAVQVEDFDLSAEHTKLTELSSDQHGPHKSGAAVSFVGTVRDLTGTLESLTLEHYPGMTEKQLHVIAAQAAEKWPLLAVRIIHRYGSLNAGDNIVLVLTHSAHRQAAFDGANYIMDFLKTQATFWKKEATKTGESHWVDARDSDTTALDKWL